MRLFNGPVFRIVAFPILFVCSVLWYLLAFRVISIPILILVVASYVIHSQTKGYMIVMTWLVFVASTFSPVDISFRVRPGTPHFAPYVLGTLSRQGMIEVDRRGLVWGGCVGTGYEPKWVWVW